MEKNATFQFVETGRCNNSVIEKLQSVQNNFQKPLMAAKGTLEILIQVSSGVLLLKYGEQMAYGINPNDQVIYDDTDKQYRLVICLDSDPNYTWIIKIQENVQLLFFIVSERCKLVSRKAATEIIIESEIAEVKAEGNTEQIKVASKNITEKQESKEANQSTQELLIETSKTLGSGLKLAGKVLSKGLQFLGSFISKRVEPAEAIEVSEDTKKMINNSVNASNKVLQITAEQFTAIFRVAKKQAIKIAQKFEESEEAKKMQKDGKYGDIKSGVTTGLKVVLNIYGGISEGLSQAGKGLAKGSAEVVGARYGKDAGEAAYGIGKGALNVYNLTKVHKDAAKKALKPEQEEEQQIRK